MAPPAASIAPGAAWDLPHLPICVCLNSDVPTVPGITLHRTDAEQLPLLTILLHEDTESPCPGQGDAEWHHTACPQHKGALSPWHPTCAEWGTWLGACRAHLGLHHSAGTRKPGTGQAQSAGTAQS